MNNCLILSVQYGIMIGNIKLSLLDKLFLIVLLLATFLRFYKYNTFSLSNDELSALYRTVYDNLDDLFKQGVKLDFHPAGIQLLL